MKQTKAATFPYVKYAIWAFTLLAIFTGAFLTQQKTAAAADVVVYRSPSCGCCGDWVKHLQDNGFTTEVHNDPNMGPIKQKLGIPPKLASCHTAKVGGYLIEGHVPADVIARLLKEKPKIKGLAVPGMPMGSPGMEGPRKDPYNVVTFDEHGNTTVYERR